MNRFQKRAMYKRQKEKQEVKKMNFDPLIKKVNEKRDKRIDPNKLPF